MAGHYIFTSLSIVLASLMLKRVAKPEEDNSEVVDWNRLPDDVYLNDALYERMGEKA